MKACLPTPEVSNMCTTPASSASSTSSSEKKGARALRTSHFLSALMMLSKIKIMQISCFHRVMFEGDVRVTMAKEAR